MFGVLTLTTERKRKFLTFVHSLMERSTQEELLGGGEPANGFYLEYNNLEIWLAGRKLNRTHSMDFFIFRLCSANRKKTEQVCRP